MFYVIIHKGNAVGISNDDLEKAGALLAIQNADPRQSSIYADALLYWAGSDIREQSAKLLAAKADLNAGKFPAEKKGKKK